MQFNQLYFNSYLLTLSNCNSYLDCFDFQVVIDLHHVGIERINGKIMYVAQCFLYQIKKVEYKCEENLLLLTSTSPSKFGLALRAIL